MVGTTSKETYVELTELGDGLLLPWLDLYETSFPPTEKVLVSDHLKVLKDKASELAAEHHLLAALNEDAALVAMARYQVIEERRVACFWYLAVASRLRNRGIGRRFYSEVLRRIKDSGCEAMVFEVQSPSVARTEEERAIAERRIGFYRGLGARVLDGIRYKQSVGSHQPETEMRIMVHALGSLTPHQAFAMASDIFGDRVDQTDPLGLE